MPASPGGSEDVPVQPPAIARCWMCENCTTEDVRNFHRFMVEKAHIVDTAEMAAHMREHLEEAAQDSDTELELRLLPTAHEILTHVSRHVLHPSVRVASILRNLLELAEMLRELIMSRADDGTPLIDVRTVTVYLKVIAEIMQIYRSADMSRMLFNDLDPS